MTNTSDNEERQSLLEFPCEFPIKMMGRDNAEFQATARDIVERHAGSVSDDAVRKSLSRNANFASLTITITATSQEQLDRIYEDLTASDEVLVAL